MPDNSPSSPGKGQEAKIKPGERISWPDYFMAIAFIAAQRSTCLRRKVGAVAVKDRRILATGYNGAPAGITHCLETGCLRQELGVPSGKQHEICRGLHAEQNVIIQAATHGISLSGADIYCTAHPCAVCAKMLINCNARHIFYTDAYPDELAAAMLAEAKIPATRISVPNLSLQEGTE